MKKYLKGVTCIGQHPMKTVAFADDAILGIRNNEDLNTAVRIIKEYDHISNDKVDIDKTVLINLDNNPWDKFILNIQQEKSSIRHLGVYLSSKGVDQKLIEDKILESWGAKIRSWKAFNRIVEGRYRIFNIFILSKLWFMAHCVSFSSDFFLQIRRLATDIYGKPKTHQEGSRNL